MVDIPSPAQNFLKEFLCSLCRYIKYEKVFASKKEILTVPNFDASSLNQPGTHIVRLGHMYPQSDGFSLTLSHKAALTTPGILVSEQQHDFLLSIDPTVADRVFAPTETKFLAALAERGALVFVADGSGVSQFDIVPVSRQGIWIVDNIDEGYIARAEDGHEFNLTEVGGALLEIFHPGRTLTSMLEQLRSAFEATDEGRALITDVEAATGASFDETLGGEALQFIKALSNEGIATFELP